MGEDLQHMPFPIGKTVPFRYDETQKVKVQIMCPPHDSCFFTFYDKH